VQQSNLKRTSGERGLEEWAVLWAACPSSHQTTSIKALKETQSTNPNQWPGLILSSSTTGLLMEEGLLPLYRLSNDSTKVISINNKALLM